MKKLILIVLLGSGLCITASAQHKTELAMQSNNTNSIILSPKKSFRLFKKHKFLAHNDASNDLPSRIQSILASDFREPSETLITRVENEKTPKNK